MPKQPLVIVSKIKKKRGNAHRNTQIKSECHVVENFNAHESWY